MPLLTVSRRGSRGNNARSPPSRTEIRLPARRIALRALSPRDRTPIEWGMRGRENRRPDSSSTKESCEPRSKRNERWKLAGEERERERESGDNRAINGRG